MARKGILTQGTDFWVLHGTIPTLTKLSCLKSWDWGDESYDELETNCLENRGVPISDFTPGKPGDGSAQIDTDPTNATHLLLLNFAATREEVTIYTGYSDGESEPTLTTGEVDLPDTRSWSYAKVSFRKGKPVIDPNSILNHTLPLRRQTEIFDQWKDA